MNYLFKVSTDQPNIFTKHYAMKAETRKLIPYQNTKWGGNFVSSEITFVTAKIGNNTIKKIIKPMLISINMNQVISILQALINALLFSIKHL